jgi:hypothetical protein
MAVHFPSWTQSYLPRVEMKDGITMVMTCQAEHQAKHIPVERQIVLLFLTWWVTADLVNSPLFIKSWHLVLEKENKNMVKCGNGVSFN